MLRAIAMSRVRWLIASSGLFAQVLVLASDGPPLREIDAVNDAWMARVESAVSPVPDWSVLATTMMGLGVAVDTAGDVNGDGFDDILVGAPYYESATLGGGALVYHGSPSGPSPTADWLSVGEQASGLYGIRVSTAGDVNNDGYDDVLVGAPYASPNQVRLYLGSATGLSTTAEWTGVGPLSASAPSIRFGQSIGSAGDINGDGYDDVVVGDPYYDADHDLGGAVFVYYGSSSGLSDWPDWEYRSPEGGARLGWAVSAAGDVNGDGFDDIIVGAPSHPYGNDERGCVYLFHGAQYGLPAIPTRIIDGEVSALPPWDRWGLGSDLSDVGDVNDDGYDDVLLGDSEWGDTHSSEGAAYLYLGSETGLDDDAAWKVEGNESDLRLGLISAGAGDVDGDGKHDLLVGGDYRKIYLYRGMTPLPSTTPEWTAQDAVGEFIGQDAAGAGDVNGDGFDDIVIGDLDYGTSGAVFVYYGLGCQDFDGDQYCAGSDCDNTNPNCTTDCTDLDGDGFCITHDCDEFRSECGANCTDDDHDFVCGEVDCDDFDPRCSEDCTSDADQDGVADCRDNCPTVPNTDQLDADFDDVGDACDCPDVDNDLDGVCDDVDNCPEDTNHDQADMDDDGLGDVCDPCPPVPGAGVDTDGDGVCDTVDTCPTEPLYGAGTSVELSNNSQVLEYDVSPSGEWAAFKVGDSYPFSSVIGVSTDTGDLATLTGALASGAIEWFEVAGDTGRVAYIADQIEGGHHLFTVPATGGAADALLEVGDFNLHGLTADGQYVVFRCWDWSFVFFGLCSMPSVGGEIRHHTWYTDGNEFGDSFIGFSPKGSSIVYGTWFGHFDDRGYNLHRVVLAGGYSVLSETWDWRIQFADDGTWMLHARAYYYGTSFLAVHHPVHGGTVLHEPGASQFDVGVTPFEGSVRVAFTTGSGPSGPGLYQVPVEGGPPLLLTSKRPDSVEVSPDCRYVVFDDEETDLQIDLYSVPTLGGEIVRLTHTPPPGGDVLDYRLSPDGQWLVYRADQGASGGIGLFAVPTAGGTPHRLNAPLASGQAVEPGYLITPSTSTVVYLADQDQPGRVELFAVPVEGGVPVKLNRPLVPGGAIEDLRMAEDGSLVFYLGQHDSPGLRELYAVVLDVDGDDVHRACDCAPTDGEAWAVPDAVPDLQLAHQGGLGGTTTLNWTPPTTPGGTAVVYDVLRSDRPDGFELGLPAYEVIATTVDEVSVEDDVDPGAVFYYRIRPGNACGDGPIHE